MRISHKHKIIFVSVPKTGTHTGIKLMEESFDAPKGPAMHAVKVPPLYLTYQAFTFVRNPYDRAVSIWNSVLNMSNDHRAVPVRDRKNFLQAIGSDDFKEFCKWLKNWPNVKLKHMACRTQAEHLADCNVPLFYVRTEHMLEDLNRFLKLNNVPRLTKVPHELKRPHKTFWELGDQECLEAINQWAINDFKYGPYKKYEIFNREI